MSCCPPPLPLPLPQASLRAELREVEHLEQLARHEPAAADIKRAFTKYDWNESGLLDAKELSAALFDLAPPCRDVIMPESEVRRVLNEYDHSGDGLLSLGEFGQLVRQLAVWDYEKEEEERVREQQENRLDSRPSSVDDGDGRASVAEPRVVLVDGLGQGLGESKASGEGAKAGGAKARKAGKRAGKEPKQKGGAEGGQPPEEVDEAAECSVPYAEVFEIRVAHSQLVEELQQAPAPCCSLPRLTSPLPLPALIVTTPLSLTPLSSPTQPFPIPSCVTRNRNRARILTRRRALALAGSLQAMREMVPLDEVEETKHYLCAHPPRSPPPPLTPNPRASQPPCLPLPAHPASPRHPTQHAPITPSAARHQPTPPSPDSRLPSLWQPPRGSDWRRHSRMRVRPRPRRVRPRSASPSRRCS